MRNPLNKRFPKEFKKNAGRYICIFLLLTVTILIGSSFLAVMESVVFTLNADQKENKVEDGQFETALPLEISIKQDLEKLNFEPSKNVNIVEKQDSNNTKLKVVENFYVSEDEYEDSARVLIFNERDEFNIPSVFKGKLPKNKNEIAIDRLFASNRDIEIGDRITLKGEKFTVSATVSFPDYNSLFKSNQDLLMNTMDFGVAVVTPEGFERFDQNHVINRYSYRYETRELIQKDKTKFEGEIREELLKNGVQLMSFLPAESNQSISFLIEDMGTDGPTMKVFIYILVAIIAFVFAILTNNTIEEESAIIGTLRSLGYTKHEILRHYLTPTAIIAAIGSIIGNALGYTIMLPPFEDIFYTTYCIPPLRLQFSVSAFLLTTVLPITIMIAVNYVMLFNKLSLSPLRFLRKDLQKRKQKKAVKLPNVSFLSRFRMRVILQNKGSYLVLFFGIYLASFLLMFGIGLGPMMDHYVNGIDDTLPYEYQYILKAPIENNVGEKAKIYSLKTLYSLSKKEINISFIGIESDSKYFTKLTLPKEKNRIVVSNSFAKKFGLTEGDTLTFTDSYYNKKYVLTVDSIAEYNDTMAAYMERSLLNEMLNLDEADYNCYYSNEKLDIDDAYIAKYVTRKDMLGAAKQMMVSFETVIQFINVFSVFVYLILMYLLTKTVIEKNAIHISFMKVFGYNGKEIKKLYLDASTITVLVSLFICIPLEVITLKYSMIYVSSLIEGYLEMYLPNWVFVTIILIGAGSYFAIYMLHILKVNRIPMNEALKNRE